MSDKFLDDVGLTYLWGRLRRYVDYNTGYQSRTPIPIPTQKTTLTYDGTQKDVSSPSFWNDFDETKMSISGVTTGTDAGTYTATFIPKIDYEWSNGTFSTANVSWTIDKINSAINVSSNSVSLNMSNLTADITITVITGDGTLSVTSSNTSIATVSELGNNVYRISAVGEGTATITASVSSTTNYNSASKTISVTSDFTDVILNNNSWAKIKEVSTAGNGSSYWNVGDCKAVTLNGTVGTLSLSNEVLYVYILGFNHNSSVEGTGISFGGFKTALTGGTDVALCDNNNYNASNSNGTKYFTMNHWGSTGSTYNTNYGGWSACDMRYDILGSTNIAPSSYGSIKTTEATGNDPTSSCTSSPVSNTLMSALPSDLRAVMKQITKYTDNIGNSANISTNVTSTKDYLPLLSEFEVFGSRSYANENEKNYQAQYTYFVNGNSKVKYRHSSTSSSLHWWLRSPAVNINHIFCRAKDSGDVGTASSRTSHGVAPTFLV